jgi:hypothetical protein
MNYTFDLNIKVMQQLYCRTTDLSDWVLQKLPAQQLLQSEIVLKRSTSSR